MGYADMLGMFRGKGKGVGPGSETSGEAQGGVEGFARAAGGALEGAGAGMIAMSNPRLARGLHAQNQATQGAYHNMYMDQYSQDRAASGTAWARGVLGSLQALRQRLGNNSEAGTDMPGAPPEGVL